MQTSADLIRKKLTLALLCGVLFGALAPTTVRAQNYATPIAPYIDDYTKVTTLVGAKQLKEALLKADAFLDSKPKDPQMRFIKGVVLTEMGLSADAITLYVTLTQDYPELPEPYNNLAVLYAADKQFEQARIALEMAIRTNPGYTIAHENLGDMYLQLAGQSYNKALQLEPYRAAAQSKLALISTLLGAKP